MLLYLLSLLLNKPIANLVYSGDVVTPIIIIMIIITIRLFL